ARSRVRVEDSYIRAKCSNRSVTTQPLFPGCFNRMLRTHHGIVAALHEGMATKQAPNCLHRATRNPETVDCFCGVFGTGWNIAAGWRKQRRDEPLISTDQLQQNMSRCSIHCNRMQFLSVRSSESHLWPFAATT